MRTYILLLLLLFCTFFFGSCTDHLDFDQISFDTESVMNTPMAHFRLEQKDFFNQFSNNEITTIVESTSFKIFESTIIQKNLVKVIFDFEISNNLDRSSQLKIDFCDPSGAVTQTLSGFNLDAGTVNHSSTRTIIINNSPEFLNSTNVRMEVSFLPSSSQLNPPTLGVFEFQSTGTFYLSF